MEASAVAPPKTAHRNLRREHEPAFGTSIRFASQAEREYNSQTVHTSRWRTFTSSRCWLLICLWANRVPPTRCIAGFVIRPRRELGS